VTARREGRKQQQLSRKETIEKVEKVGDPDMRKKRRTQHAFCARRTQIKAA